MLLKDPDIRVVPRQRFRLELHHDKLIMQGLALFLTQKQLVDHKINSVLIPLTGVDIRIDLSAVDLLNFLTELFVNGLDEIK